MDKEKKKKLLWLLIIILVLIGLVVLFLSLNRGEKIKPSNEDFSTENQPKFAVESVPKEEPRKINPDENSEFTASNLAKNFANRFGSWSTDNQGQNLDELASITTKQMQNYLQSIQINYNNQEFLGVTTKALSAEVTSMDAAEDEAEVTVQAQRIETKADRSEKIYYQKAKAKLIKVQDQWLVDEFVWQ